MSSPVEEVIANGLVHVPVNASAVMHLSGLPSRYQIKTDKASGITNDPNDWSREVKNPRYMFDLIARITTVSIETMKIVDTLPPLRIIEDNK